MTVVQPDRERPQLLHLPTTAALFQLIRDLQLGAAVLDIPIGLPPRELRRCDLEARRLLGRAAPSVFLTPPRAVLQATSQKEASSIWRQLSGRGCPAQTFGILARIREVDMELRAHPLPAVHEGHPELAFQRLAEGTPLASKHIPAGRAERAGLLQPHLPELPSWLDRHPGLVEDVLDACACWLVARWVIEGSSRRLPAEAVELDEWNTPMAIRY